MLELNAFINSFNFVLSLLGVDEQNIYVSIFLLILVMCFTGYALWQLWKVMK